MTEETRESSFDALAKGMASGTVSRGRALRLMGAALLGGTLASVPAIASAAPKPKPNGRKCKQSSQCASGNCAGGVCSASLPNGETCTSNAQCFSDNCSTNGVCSVGCCNCPTNCSRYDRADGTGTVCIDCSVGCPSGLSQPSDCTTDPRCAGKVCVVTEGFEGATEYGCGAECS